MNNDYNVIHRHESLWSSVHGEPALVVVMSC
jgi:hypothetical protein